MEEIGTLKENIKQIYKEYRSLEVKDIDLYINFLRKKYLVDEEYIRDTIRKYVKTLSEKEQEEYSFKMEDLKEHKKIIRRCINNYVRTKSKSSVLELLKMGSSDSINSYLDNYLIRNPKNNKAIVKLKEELILLEQQIINKEVYKQYLESGNASQSIVNLIALLFCNQEEAILLLKGYSIPKIIFDKNLEEFKTLFPNQKEDYTYLKEIYEKYAKRYNIAASTSFYEEKIKLLKEIAESGKSVPEYLSYYGKYTVTEITKIFTEIRKLGNENYILLIESIQSKDDKNFIQHLKEIALEIYEKENFEIADYYECTKLQPITLKIYMQKYIENNPVRECVFYKINRAFDFNGPCFSERFFANNPELEKKVKTILKEKGVPYSRYVLDYYVKKYESGELLFETEKEIKEGF